MGELRREFLKQTISNLQALQKESLSQEIFSADFLRRFFRHLHTIKGTSGTFTLENLARLSHQLENLLQAVQSGEVMQEKTAVGLLREGIDNLIGLAATYERNRETFYPQEFTDRLQAILPAHSEENKNTFNFQLPKEFVSLLSLQEKANLGNALRKGYGFYIFAVFLGLSDFAQDFKRLKEILNKNGEVIAVSSAVSQTCGDKIGFQIFSVSLLSKIEFWELIKEFSPEIIFEDSPIVKNVANNLGGLLANLVADGEKIARMLDKRVAFETSFSLVQPTDESLLLLHEIASHLIHNSLDHGIETVEKRISTGKNPEGKIEINISSTSKSLILQVKDDGSGIDAANVTALARRKGIISSRKKLKAAEALDIIFAPGFSTSEKVSEISGRGVGLDAVKDLVEKSGGKIEIETEPGKGTTFSIYLGH